MMMEAVRSSEMLVLTTAMWRHIPEDGILYSHCHEDLTSYKFTAAYFLLYSCLHFCIFLNKSEVYFTPMAGQQA
jgi:hypothetical protein